MPVLTREDIDRLNKEYGSGAGVIGVFLVELGYHCYVDGHDFWAFWEPIPTDGSVKKEVIQKKLQDRLPEGNYPQYGVKVTTRKNVFNGSPYDKDWQDFIRQRQADAFKMIMDSLIDNEIPVGEEFFGKAEFKADPYKVSLGEEGKKEGKDGIMRFPTIRVPVQVYANETEARAAAGSNANASDDTAFSQTARDNYPDVNELENLSEEIVDWLNKAKEGVAFSNDAKNFPLPKPATSPSLKKYIAGIYNIESSDIDLLIPF